MQIHVSADPAAFGDAVEPLLRADPVRGTVLISTLGTLQAGGSFGDEPPAFAWAVDRTGVVAAALHTPPRHVVCTDADPSTAAALVEAVAGPAATGVTGPARSARAAALARGGPWRVAVTETQYRLDAVLPPRRDVPGTARLTTERDDPLLEGWLRVFRVDTGISRAEDPRRVIAGRRRSGGHYWVWEDAAPTCLVGHTAPVYGVPRVGPVFTAREARGRGFAQRLTAHVCAALLAGGASALTLFADAANPASNAAYRAIGFRPVGETVEIDFG